MLLVGAMPYAAGATTSETAAPLPRPITVLVLGDSISAGYGIQRKHGWVALLEARLHALNDGNRVVNASISGDTTGGGLARLPMALKTHQPDIVVIELGGNDGLRGYPVRSIRDNLLRTVALTNDHGGRAILIGMRIPPNYGARYADAFHAVYGQVSEATGASLVPFLLEGVATREELMQPDGIHPKAEAQAALLDTAWPYLTQLLED
jgi:acyl-CoA thioesterase-1